MMMHTLPLVFLGLLLFVEYVNATQSAAGLPCTPSGGNRDKCCTAVSAVGGPLCCPKANVVVSDSCPPRRGDCSVQGTATCSVLTGPAYTAEWVDAQGLGVARDFCRFVENGLSGQPWFGCALAGTAVYTCSVTKPGLFTADPLHPTTAVKQQHTLNSVIKGGEICYNGACSGYTGDGCGSTPVGPTSDQIKAKYCKCGPKTLNGQKITSCACTIPWGLPYSGPNQLKISCVDTVNFVGSIDYPVWKSTGTPSTTLCTKNSRIGSVPAITFSTSGDSVVLNDPRLKKNGLYYYTTSASNACIAGLYIGITVTGC